MEKQKQNIRSWDDLIFENRNKAYGAYAIRQDYSNGLLKGVLVSVGFATVILAAIGALNGSTIVEQMIPETPIEFGSKPTIKANIIPQTQQTKPQHQVNRNVAPIAGVTPDPVEPTTEPVTTSTGSTEGTDNNTGGSDGNASNGVDTGIDSGIEPVKDNKPFITVEVMPAYKGGFEGMMKALKKNMRYPASARRMGKEGTVHVEFIINDLGEITDVKVLRGFDLDCDKEAVRMVQKLTEWTPGFQNNLAVNVKMVLPIKFQLEK